MLQAVCKVGIILRLFTCSYYLLTELLKVRSRYEIEVI